MLSTDSNGMMCRQNQLLDYLSTCCGDASVDVLAVADNPSSFQRRLGSDGLRCQVLSLPKQKSKQTLYRIWLLFNQLLSAKAGMLPDFYTPSLLPIHKSFANGYDLIVCFYPWLYILLGLDRFGPKVVVDTGDVMGGRYKRIGFRRWISISKHDERRILRSNARCIAISEIDRDAFIKEYDVELPIVPYLPRNHCDLAALSAQSVDVRRVGFFAARGALNAKTLADVLLEPVVSGLAVRGAKLVLAGGVCNELSPSQKALCGRWGVEVMGYVKSEIDFYKQVDVCLNPVGPSTGMKIKSVEALLAGRVLVATEWGSDGTLERVFKGGIRRLQWPLNHSELIDFCLQEDRRSGNDRTAASRLWASDVFERSSRYILKSVT
jgi:hypothetical protein